jgi:hypothetical protein
VWCGLTTIRFPKTNITKQSNQVTDEKTAAAIGIGVRRRVKDIYKITVGHQTWVTNSSNFTCCELGRSSQRKSRMKENSHAHN